MDKNKNKGRVVDIAVVLLCLSGAAAAFALFWLDLNKTFTRMESPVATISFKRRTAQRRFGDRTAWDMLRQDAAVYSGDVIHTTDLSDVNILFSGGQFVQLGENSLIQVFYSEAKGARVEFSGGSIDLSAGDRGALVLVSGGTEVIIGAGGAVSANTNAEGGSGMNVTVREGVAEINSGGGRQEAAAGTAVVVAENGEIAARPQVAPRSPRPNQTLLRREAEAQPLTFTWSTVNFTGGETVRFEIATDRRFTRIVDASDVRDESQVVVSLPSGQYWWRVYPIVAGDSFSAAAPVNALVIRHAVAPVAVAPAEGTRVSFYAAAPSVRFRWTEDGDDQEYLLEAADNPAMRNPRLSTLVRGSSFLSSGLESGRWYWRVRPLSGEADESLSFVSETVSFEIYQLAGLAAPQLVMPVAEKSLAMGESLPSLTFSWRNESEAERYTLQVATEREFTYPLLKSETPDNFYVYSADALSSGTYFWRVTYATADGRQSPTSEIRSFSVGGTPAAAVKVTLENPPDNHTVTEAAELVFSWRNSGVARSRFSLATVVDFSKVLVDEETPTNEYRGLALDAGTYFWRVSVSAGGKEVQSAVRRLTITPSPPHPVVLLEPVSGSSIPGLEALRNPRTLRWQTEGAPASFRLVLSRNPDPLGSGGELLDTNNPMLTEALLPRLSAGTYYWTIQAETAEGFDISAVSPSSFTVAPVPLLPAPANLQPAANRVFDTGALRESRRLSLSWNAVANANAYRLSVSREGAGAPFISVEALRRTSYVIEDLIALGSGAYVWRVEALGIAADGAVEQRGTVAQRRFVVDLPTIEAPRLHDTGMLYGNEGR